MELADGLLLIAASGIGAICGILGQSIKERWSRPNIRIGAVTNEGTLFLHFANTGRKSTEDLAIDIVNYGEDMLAGNEKVIFHSTDMTIHPGTAQMLIFGRIEDGILRIRKSEFGKIIKYTDSSDDGTEEWVFPLPVSFYISACAKDTSARMKILSVDGNGIRIENPKKISYRDLQSSPRF
ncbi:MAG: hypothetical protein LBH69_05080 [Methanomassiliicoccaceae archaeon]|jgi:outer membrane protein assembly factor BamB|nr:hypothetical protein [Methanomassiliicoccaceae archaeon]